jgi:predicted peptidase
VATKAAGYESLLSLPRGYDPAAGRRWPLLVFLHGSGESGTDVHRVAVNGPPKLLRTDVTLTPEESAAAVELAENFIVVSPQCPDEGVAWEDDKVLALIDQVQAQFHVDPDRVYLTGLSMGGYGAWSLALRHADRFAAVAPISGGGNYLDALNAADGTAQHAAALRSLGLWVFHGAKDDVVPVSEATRMVDALVKGGAKDVKLTVNADRGHDVWNVVYADVHFYEWLLQHRRGS